jgi:hypothetical protein
MKLSRVKRSIMTAEWWSSLSIEKAFWNHLKAIAMEPGLNVPALVDTIKAAPVGAKPEHHWPKHVAREVARRALAGERMPTAPEMLEFCRLKWDWQPDERQMQRVLRELLVYFD